MNKELLNKLLEETRSERVIKYLNKNIKTGSIDEIEYLSTLIENGRLNYTDMMHRLRYFNIKSVEHEKDDKDLSNYCFGKSMVDNTFLNKIVDEVIYK